MCGITGIFNYRSPDRPIDRALLERMTRSIAHRGPDGEGFHVDGPLGLGHRRLAIVDLTPTGAQPMPTLDGRCWLSYNGEFYDHLAYRPALAARAPFRGTSDTETLLRLLEEKGPAALADLSAIFGLAFWDSRKQTLLLARDPIGVKQLYYFDDGERILFASEIKALLQCAEVPRELDVEALNQYLHFHTALFDRTFFRGIRQLLPGQHLEVTQGRAPTLTRYFRIDDFSPACHTPDEYVEAVRETVARVVADQLMSDVPVGTFFSGGIDSSAVASFAKRAGTATRCFGVHFTGQGVIDERPFQESAAKALGLDLQLLTLDGASFPDDLRKLMYFQDEPAIGTAMLPMYSVARLASQQVKVCLGGQAADELFGGYARYSLAHPLRAGLSMAGQRLRALAGSARQHDGNPSVGGNLAHQLVDPLVLVRLARNARHLVDWRELYFANFAKVPEASWNELFSNREVVSRENCRQQFFETVGASAAADPATKAMHWDAQTYLPGLFQQDDRMSMANGLESRVPLADPRLVRLAFRTPFDVKVREGASKWVLRRAVADVLPAEVLTRRKVGFDTPAESWMKGPHAGFVRETLLGKRARERGLWNPRGVEAWLDAPGRPHWFDAMWKVLGIETWAQLFLDGAAPAEARAVPEVSTVPRPAPPTPSRPGLGDAVQELRELGPGGIAFRAGWELKLRSGLTERLERAPPRLAPGSLPSTSWLATRLRIDTAAVREAVRERIGPARLAALARQATLDGDGRILCFGRWVGDFGRPIDWHVNPVNGRRWDPHAHWSRALRDEERVGDVKLTWEAGRFPQAFRMARAAALLPEGAVAWDEALAAQLEGFIAANPFGRGVHWASGQELVFRLVAWSFALNALGPQSAVATRPLGLSRHLYESFVHIDRHLEYARQAVHNNHLLSEASGLLLGAQLLQDVPEAPGWRRTALSLLGEEAGYQFYADGAYIQQSHTYERVAMQVYLFAAGLLRAQGAEVPRPWLAALERGLDFLLAQQNPEDGRLPNYGSNDGSQPGLLSTCDYGDFRPLLQSVSLLTRGERVYPAGPWDEESAWWLGPKSLEAPLVERKRTSVSFAQTGYHVLRGREQGSYCAFRCGNLTDRFAQIDMLSLDVWWRGQNVLVDGGSYLYNGPPQWHDHFVTTASHNTVVVDGRDQMLHYRRFKSLYWTRAALLDFQEHEGWALCAGEHEGYARHPGGCIHRRSVLFAKDDVWVVADTVRGTGAHTARLHWLCGEYASQPEPGGLTLDTPQGKFGVAIFSADGQRAATDVVSGQLDPPRGWLSRYYGEKVPVPSLATTSAGETPLSFVTVLSPGAAIVRVEGERWRVEAGGRAVGFTLHDGLLGDVALPES